MTGTIFFWTGMALSALAVAGCLFELAAMAALLRFFRRTPATVVETPGVTLLKPLHGDEPRLGANLASFLDQDYAGSMQMVCGVAEEADPARATAERLRRERPNCDITVVAGPHRPFANGKIGNLVNMLGTARHDVLVLSDSDMTVSPRYLLTVIDALMQPGVGAVTCAYRGRGDAGFWSEISASGISYIMLPGVILGYLGGMARPCMGSTIALTRATLGAIGGFERFADVLADDYAIGEAVAELGQRVEIAPLLIVHACCETSLAALWRQKLRWAMTIRAVAPRGHLGSIITYPLPLALAAVPFAPMAGMWLVAASLAIRLALARLIDRQAGEHSAPWWMIPASECIEFLAVACSFVARKIDWRGRTLSMQRNGRIAAAKRQ